MIHQINTEWIGNMCLETDVNGHKILMDAEEEFGGKDAGARPKPLLLSALSGCTAMDVISILGKKQVAFNAFRIHVSGELAEEHPKSYKKIHIIYEFTGKDFDGNDEIIAKINRAVQLSFDNYCGIAAMLKKACDLTYEIKLLNL